LHTFHQLDQEVVTVGPHRGEAHAAVAHHHGGGAVPRRRRDLGVPRHLAVVVRVHVDPAGRHDRTVGVDLARARAGDVADLGDHAVVDGDVTGTDGTARAVDNGSAADDQVVHLLPQMLVESRIVPGPHNVGPWTGRMQYDCSRVGAMPGCARTPRPISPCSPTTWCCRCRAVSRWWVSARTRSWCERHSATCGRCASTSTSSLCTATSYSRSGPSTSRYGRTAVPSPTGA